MARSDLTDQEWTMIGPLLPSERGRWVRPAGDNRLFLNGMLYVLLVGCPWRDMHERYGKWNWFMSGLGVGLNRACGMPCCKPW
ncbi:transposase [Gluconobacter cerinus]|uniref:transposase n=1 Tax=Gluconobacter cerinus TaxID=38307 RepID=UPI0023F9559F|nr:transposase [Gluconobacter cerinus]